MDSILYMQFNIPDCNTVKTERSALIYCNRREDVLGIITSQFDR